ncbi:MAG: hypothetical protein KAG20_05690 [Cocleimonas sp.]|nr:hypothetical protein [Cocleimonas sp.]
MNDFMSSVLTMYHESVYFVTQYVMGSFASIFILGVLTGWLVEWLFYYFFWKKEDAQKTVVTPSEKEGEETNNTIDYQAEKLKKEQEIAKSSVKKQIETQQIKPTTNQQKKIIKPTETDDFTKLLGIGAGLSKRLEEIGICSFKQLNEISVEELIEQLVAKGARINNKGIMASWAKQAKFADDGDIDGLKAFQNELKKG